MASLSFEVVYVLGQEAARVVIAGRNCQDPIRIGDAFHYAYPLEIRKLDYSDKYYPIPGVVRRVCLRVQRIEWYHRFVDVLAHAHAGALTLVGIGSSEIEPEWHIATLDVFQEQLQQLKEAQDFLKCFEKPK